MNGDRHNLEEITIRLNEWMNPWPQYTRYRQIHKNPTPPKPPMFLS